MCCSSSSSSSLKQLPNKGVPGPVFKKTPEMSGLARRHSPTPTLREEPLEEPLEESMEESLEEPLDVSFVSSETILRTIPKQFRSNSKAIPAKGNQEVV